MEQEAWSAHYEFLDDIASFYGTQNDEMWKSFVHAPSNLQRDFFSFSQTSMAIFAGMFAPVYKDNNTDEPVALMFDSKGELITPEDYKKMKERELDTIKKNNELICGKIEICDNKIKAIAAKYGRTSRECYLAINTLGMSKFPHLKNDPSIQQRLEEMKKNEI